MATASVIPGGTDGIRNPRAGEAFFTLQRAAPAAALATLVERFWIVRWNLRGDERFAQETLPHPCVNIVIGTHRSGVHGVGTERFVAKLAQSGWVLGAKLKPGGFFPFYGRDVSELTGRERTIADVFGDDGARCE